MVQINSLLLIFLAIFGTRSLCQVVLSRLNIRHLHRAGGQVPDVFGGLIDQGELARISSYTADSASVRLRNSLLNQSILLALLLSGLLPWLVEGLSQWISQPIAEGLVFFGVLSLMFNLIQIPFDLYETFVIEERYGFNTRDLKTWALDLLKGTIISATLGGIALGIILILINRFQQTWWIWAWIFLAIVEGIILWLYPIMIAPWFNRFEPITQETLNRRISELMEAAGLGVKGIFQMDAGKRTRHTNAYFTGLGRSKRIVLFDTLLNAHTEDEILAILSHEAGHWKRKHIIKHLLLLEITSLFGLFVVARLISWPPIYWTFGFDTPAAFVGLFLAGVLTSPVAYFFRPLGSAISRRFEQEADDVAFELLGTSTFLSRALKKLALYNLANLDPHPLYAWFYYSHPPIVKRVERLERMGAGRGSQ